MSISLEKAPPRPIRVGQVWRCRDQTYEVKIIRIDGNRANGRARSPWAGREGYNDNGSQWWFQTQACFDNSCDGHVYLTVGHQEGFPLDLTHLAYDPP